MPVTNSLEALPQDLIIQISSYLRLLDKLKLSCVSKHQKQSIRVSAEERELARSLPNLIRGELSVNQIQRLRRQPEANREIQLYAREFSAAYSISDLEAIQLSQAAIQQELSIRSQELRQHSISCHIRSGIASLAIGLGLLIAGLVTNTIGMSIFGVGGLIVGLLILIRALFTHRSPASDFALAASFTRSRDAFGFSNERRYESALALRSLRHVDRERQIRGPNLNQPQTLFYNYAYTILQGQAARAGNLSRLQQSLLADNNQV